MTSGIAIGSGVIRMFFFEKIALESARNLDLHIPSLWPHYENDVLAHFDCIVDTLFCPSPILLGPLLVPQSNLNNTEVLLFLMSKSSEVRFVPGPSHKTRAILDRSAFVLLATLASLDSW